MDTSKSLRNHQTGAALVMTLGIMLIMVIVLLIASQYTLKGVRTVRDQSATLEAQYVSESGLAWAEAYSRQLMTRFSGLQPSNRSIDHFKNLLSAVCATDYNDAATDICELPETEPAASTARQKIAEFFQHWENKSTTDNFWQGIFSTGKHVIPLGNNQSYTVYNVYKMNNEVRESPLFSVNRLEWDIDSAGLMTNFRFCYDVGYFVSQGITSSGNRVVGQFPKASNSTTETKCPAEGAISSSTSPNRNYIEVTAEGQKTQETTTVTPDPTDIDPDVIAGAATIEKTGFTTTEVTYTICGQTNNTSQACGSDRQYTITYIYSGPNAYSVRCRQPANNIDTTVKLTLQNTIDKCQVRSQSNAESKNDYVYFFRDINNHLVFVLGGKTEGNADVSAVSTNGNPLPTFASDNADHVARMIYLGTCNYGGSAQLTPGVHFASSYVRFAVKGPKDNGGGNGGGGNGGGGNGGGGNGGGTSISEIPMSSEGCVEATKDTLDDILGNTTTYPPVTVPGQIVTTYQFKPTSTNADLIFTGRWVQLDNGDL